MLLCVKLTPSSGLAIGSPTIAPEDCRAYVAAPPTSPCSQVFPGRRNGPPSGDLTAPPALSLRAEGTEASVRPPCTGGDAGRELPVPSNRSGRRRWTFICSARDRIFIVPVCCSSPQGRGPGFILGPLILDRDLSSIAQPKRNRLGVCVCVCVCVPKCDLTEFQAGGHCPTRCFLQQTTSESSRAIDSFIIALLHQLSKLIFLSKLAAPSEIPLYPNIDLSLLTAERKRKRLVRGMLREMMCGK